MSDEEDKILQLETELEKLSSQIDYYKDQVKQLKEKTTAKPVATITEAEAVLTAPGSKWEYPSHKHDSSEEGLEKFIGLRLLHFTGIIALVIGLSIGVKYAIDKDLVTPAARIALAYLAGIILYFLSVRVKKKYAMFSAILLSGAMASLYFTSFAAYTYYHLIHGGLAFTLMLSITIYTVYEAIRYNREEIAILGMVGAYGIPFLVSVNSGRADLFFTYILIINTGIVFLSWKKHWKNMIALAIAVSWILFIGWGFTRYNDGYRSLAITIMCAFYLLFSVGTIGYPIYSKKNIPIIDLLRFLVNTVLTFAAALLIFSNQNIFVGVREVTGVGCIIFMLQAITSRQLLPQEKLLFNSLIAFSVLCLIFYIGIRWTGMPVTMGWLLTAAGLFTIGVLSKINWFRLVSVILTALTLIKLVLLDRTLLSPGEKIISYISIGAWMLLLSFFYQRYKKQLLENAVKE